MKEKKKAKLDQITTDNLIEGIDIGGGDTTTGY